MNVSPVLGSQGSVDEKEAEKNTSDINGKTDIHEGLSRDTAEELMNTDQSMEILREGGQDQRLWKSTLLAALRLFVESVCYGAISSYSLILMTFMNAYEKLFDLYSRKGAIESDLKLREALNVSASPSDDVIDFVSTVSIPSLPSPQREADDFCVNHEHFLYKEAFASLDRLRRNERLCDVELSVGDHRTINAHKVVLAAVIPYFEAMFAMDMSELKKRNIIIRNLEYEVLELFVSYAYCGRLHINAQNVLKVIFAANFLQLNHVTEECGQYLRRQLHPSNVLSIRAYCSALNCRSAMEATERFIEKYFTLICRTEEFLQISVDDLVYVLSMDGLYVEAEEKVFEAALAWIEHDRDARKAFACRVLACIHLTTLSPSFLAATVARHPLIHDDPKCYELPRVCRDLPCQIFAMGGVSNEDTTLSEVERYDPLTRQWVPTLSMPSPREAAGIAVCDGKVASMPTARTFVSAAFLNNELYVCGGRSANGVLNAVQVFNPEQNKWSTTAAMSAIRVGAAVAVLDGYLYVLSVNPRKTEVSVMGGSDGNSALSSVERFSPDKRVWEKVVAMQSQRLHAAAAVLNGKIYVCGGTNGWEDLNSVECFDPSVNRWFPVAPMKVVRSGLSVVAYDNAIYAIAGKNDFSTLASMEIYHDDTNEWEFAAYLTSARSYLVAAVVPISPTMLGS
ncbi:BTB/POZ domain protein [Ancylostoma caninum]|uniref:BTB/POZ domain protein n=1 Tax=Ancylostoma caninum TaxID=29170 RepID=A0A368H4L1_ANCCA|nr:BTB/POZ domain protein [Ancylostoma caninum]